MYVRKMTVELLKKFYNKIRVINSSNARDIKREN